MFLGGDGSIWGIGYRCQGAGEENCKLKKITAPDAMRNIKDVCHGKFFRAVVTEDGRFFWNGQSRRYMMGFGGSGTSRTEGFHEMENNYFRIEEGDKLVGCAGGKNFAIVCTERGKVFATSYMFYRYFSECRHNPENNEDYPFELRMPEGYQAKKVYGAEKYYNMWATCADADGGLKTFGAGNYTELTGHGESSNTSSFKPLKVPDGTHMTRITCQG